MEVLPWWMAARAASAEGDAALCEGRGGVVLRRRRWSHSLHRRRGGGLASGVLEVLAAHGMPASGDASRPLLSRFAYGLLMEFGTTSPGGSQQTAWGLPVW